MSEVTKWAISTFVVVMAAVVAAWLIFTHAAIVIWFLVVIVGILIGMAVLALMATVIAQVKRWLFK